MFTKLVLLCAVAIAATTTATPWTSEPRPDDWWHKTHESLVNRTKHEGAQIKAIFLGDSITQGWNELGAKVWKEHYANRHAYNYGIGGDRTENVLWRIEHGEFDGLNPKVVVLMIGTNNVSIKEKADDIAHGYIAIVNALRAKMPHTRILMCAVLPRNTVALDTVVRDINVQIAHLANNKKGLHYLNLEPFFETGLAKQHAQLYVADLLHLSEQGYEMWYEKMDPTFTTLMDEGRFDDSPDV